MKSVQTLLVLKDAVNGVITLSGDLVNSSECREDLSVTFHTMKNFGKAALTIDASNVSINPQGVDLWVELVEKYFPKTRLDYLPSQLVDVLKYHQGYNHPKSFCQGEPLPMPRQT